MSPMGLALKQKGSNEICDHDIKMKGLRCLHGTLEVVFAYGELDYGPVKKRQLLTKKLILCSSNKVCKKPKLFLLSYIA